jgi:hypothetical protein
MAEFRQELERLSRSQSAADRAKAQELIRNSPADQLRQAGEVAEEMHREGRTNVGNAAMLILGIEGTSPGYHIPDEQFMRAWISWNKYGKTIPQLRRESEGGTWQAMQKLLQIEEVYQQWRFGKLQPDEMRFKSDHTHFALLKRRAWILALRHLRRMS